jgi:hypothetical protein
MTKERLIEMIDGVLAWGADHDEEFRGCLVDALDITEEEYKELFDEDLNAYLGEEDEGDESDDEEDEEELTDEDYEDQFGSEMAIRICRANNIPLSDIEEYGSEAYWINDGINNLQDLYDINENFVIPTGDEDLIRDYRKEILEEDE